VNFERHHRRLIAIGLFVSLSALTLLTAPSASVQASGNSVSFFISAPGVEGPPSLSGLTMETFNTASIGEKLSGSALAVGNITTSSTCNSNSSGIYIGASVWAGAVTSTDTPYPSNFNLPASPPNTNYPFADKTQFAYPSRGCVAIQLSRAVNYLGLYWAAGSTGNQIRIRSGSTLIASFSTNDLMSIIPTSTSNDPMVTAIGGAQYDIDHYEAGHKDGWDGWRNPPRWSEQPYAYIHIVAPQGITFDSVELTSAQFEFDNLAIANYSGTFNSTGFVGIPLTSASGAQPAFTTVTFQSNDGNNGSTTQSALMNSATALQNNPFTRTGHTFAGWSTSPTGTVSYTDNASYSFGSDLTLHAMWTLDPVTTTSSPNVAVTTTTPTVAVNSASPTTTPVQPVQPVTSQATAASLPATGQGMSAALFATWLLVVGVLLRRHRHLLSHHSK
jgi:uncharacterized repeat protein (TIGR02543 family)